VGVGGEGVGGGGVGVGGGGEGGGGNRPNKEITPCPAHQDGSRVDRLLSGVIFLTGA
jgi:hypothetical protein